MQLFVVNLDDSEEFLQTLSKLKDDGLNGIVIPTTSLKHALIHSHHIDDVVPIFGSLSKIVKHDYQLNHTLLMLVKDEEIEEAKRIVRDTTKGLGKKGVMFALPVSFWEGLEEK